MAQTSPLTGKKPVAKPAGNPYANIQVAPRAAPTVNMVRPSVPTPTNPFFNYISPKPYNNPFREYKPQPIETNSRPVNLKFFNPVFHGSTAQKEGVVYPEGASRYAPEADLLYNRNGGPFDEYVRQRNQLYANRLVEELKQFKDNPRSSQGKQLFQEMVDRQRLNTTNPMVGMEALGMFPKELLTRNPYDEPPLGRGGAPGHMPPPRIASPRDDYTLEEEQADAENQGYEAFAYNSIAAKDFSQAPLYITYRDQDRVGKPTPNSSVKAKAVHEATHFKGYVDQQQRDKQIANYFKIITNDPVNYENMLARYKNGMNWWGNDYDYEASPEEMLARIAQTRQYMKDVYGSDEFHKLTAKDAVRIWLESFRYITGVPTNDTSLWYADLYDPQYTADQNLTPEQIRLLLQNNLWQ